MANEVENSVSPKKIPGEFENIISCESSYFVASLSNNTKFSTSEIKGVRGWLVACGTYTCIYH